MFGTLKLLKVKLKDVFPELDRGDTVYLFEELDGTKVAYSNQDIVFMKEIPDPLNVVKGLEEMGKTYDLEVDGVPFHVPAHLLKKEG